MINDFTDVFHERIEFYRAKGEFPLTGPVEIRCCGLDQAADVKVPSVARDHLGDPSVVRIIGLGTSRLA